MTVKMAKSIVQVDNVVFLEDLLEAIEREFDNLQKCFYSIECHDKILDLKDERSLKFIRDNGKSVKVTKDVTGFGDVEVSDIQKHINLKFSNADNLVTLIMLISTIQDFLRVLWAYRRVYKL